LRLQASKHWDDVKFFRRLRSDGGSRRRGICVYSGAQSFPFTPLSWRGAEGGLFLSLRSLIGLGLFLKWANYLRGRFGKGNEWVCYSMPRPELVVWIKPVGSNASTVFPNGPTTELSVDLADDDGAIAGTRGYFIFSAGASPCLTALQFEAVPRRSRMLHLLFQEKILRNGKELGTLHPQNPLFGRYPQWKAEPLPASRMAGDVRVKLTKFAFSSNAPAPAVSRESSFTIETESRWGSHESWLVESCELSDATGNDLFQGYANPAGTNSYRLRGTLWPGEQAYKLRLALKRVTGYEPGETITFTNLPVTSPARSGGFNFPFNGTALTNVISGRRVVARNFLGSKRAYDWNGPAPGPCWVEWELLDESDELSVGFGRVVTDTGEQVHGPELSSYNQYYLNFHSMAPNVRSMNVTLVVQKKRYVEFLVKPQ
jgi:hypothetical protein